MMTQTKSTIRAGVMGWPVGHSLSPKLHGYWLKKYGIDGSYEAIPVEPDHFSERLLELAGAGYAGVNVTLPHKKAALKAVHTVSPEARRIGAVNTIVMHSDGTLEGRNTDAFGFLENLKSARPGWSAGLGPAVLIGAGGAARAVAWALVNDGVPEVRIINRTL
ncbi:MAG TPA: shikimate dehydrogenase, partial [Rhodospirillales bacterium]|nr:shikimate dehydrogenase [Rhodospirillales bacterium]